MRSEVYALDDRAKIVITWPGDVKLYGSDSDRLADWLALVRDKIMDALIVSVSLRPEPDPWTPGEAEELSKVDFIPHPGQPEPPEAKPLFTGKVYLGDLRAACEAYNEGNPDRRMILVMACSQGAKAEPLEAPEPPLLRPETPRKCSGYKQSELGVVIARCTKTEGHEGPHTSPRGQEWHTSPPQADYSEGAQRMAELQREADVSSRIPRDYLAELSESPETRFKIGVPLTVKRPDRHCDPGCILPMRPHTGRCMNAHGYELREDVVSQMRQAEPGLFKPTPEPVKLVDDDDAPGPQEYMVSAEMKAAVAEQQAFEKSLMVQVFEKSLIEAEKTATFKSEIPIMYGVNMREALSLGAGMVPELAEATIPPVHHAEVLSVMDEARNELAELEAFGKSLEAKVTAQMKAAIADQTAERDVRPFKWNDPAYKAEPIMYAAMAKAADMDETEAAFEAAMAKAQIKYNVPTADIDALDAEAFERIAGEERPHRRSDVLGVIEEAKANAENATAVGTRASSDEVDPDDEPF